LLHRRGSLLGGSTAVTPIVATLPGGAIVGFAARI
jgi:hypothetical protein